MVRWKDGQFVKALHALGYDWILLIRPLFHVGRLHLLKINMGPRDKFSLPDGTLETDIPYKILIMGRFAFAVTQHDTKIKHSASLLSLKYS